jgi:diaminohydroxyphosphoribosylaminopyrimidine deaminase/5-amino-6-(5-phosphoribosylamino)uracil reductase
MTAFSAFDHSMMRRALALAQKGLYTATPNPRVGCVLVQGEQVVGEGWHEKTGAPHAEARALLQASAAAKGSTVYVTLEPCNHHGKTPPCAEALIKAKVVRVVAAMRDPNPESRKGGDALVAAGIPFEFGLLEDEARELNIGFVSRMAVGADEDRGDSGWAYRAQ